MKSLLIETKNADHARRMYYHQAHQKNPQRMNIGNFIINNINFIDSSYFSNLTKSYNVLDIYWS